MAEVVDPTSALAERLFDAAVGGFDLVCIHIGDRLGLYRVLNERGPSTGEELADATGIHPRYAREWLEQQAVSGILEVDDGADGERRFRLPEAHVPVLLNPVHPAHMTPMAQLFVACTRPVDAVIQAFRTGEGVPYADYGADLHEGQARFTHPLFHNELADDWLGAVPEIHGRLSNPPARVADLACGLGRSTIAIAAAYPGVRVDGIDLDAASIAVARRILEESPPEIAGRVTFTHGDAAEAGPEGAYDLVTIFEALHDMSYPVATLAAARRLVGDSGLVFIGDERTAEEFDPDAGDLERLYYGFSVTHCLPVGMTGPGAAGTGTVIRSDTVRAHAREAGFSAVEVLPIDHDFWRFYLLRP